MRTAQKIENQGGDVWQKSLEKWAFSKNIAASWSHRWSIAREVVGCVAAEREKCVGSKTANFPGIAQSSAPIFSAPREP